MPINVLSKDTPRGRGPEPTQAASEKQKEKLDEGDNQLKEADLADQEAQALWESQEVGHTSWSGQGGDRYSDPN